MADPEGKAEEAAEQMSEEPTSEEPSSQDDGQGLATQLMQNPQVLAALQDRLGSIVGGSSGYIQSLPKPVKRRIKALKKLQFEATKIEAEFYREVHRLECQYAAKYTPLVEKRSTMVNGAYEPNDEEADWPSDDEKDEDLAEEVKNKVSVEDQKEEGEEEKKDEKEEEETKGIPGFWLTIFKNVDMLSEMIQPHDEPILNHVTDVKVEFKEKDPMGFTLEFYFEANEFFDNKKLTKSYVMKSEPDETDPFSFEGPEIVKCSGCSIDWKKGKNVTVKTVKKKQKHKASGTTRTISKTVQSDSFFNFFSPPTPPDDDEMDEDTEALLAADFEIGHFIRERIVPRAVLYFTGEALENDDDFEDGEEEDGGEEGDYDEDGDPDYHPSGKYLSADFQARCATLALGRRSHMSSAPNDTRAPIFARPSSGSTIRRDATMQTDISSRPGTAPVHMSSSFANTISDDLGKPKTITNAFSETGNTEKDGLNTSNIQNRPKTVTFGKGDLRTSVNRNDKGNATVAEQRTTVKAEVANQRYVARTAAREQKNVNISNAQNSQKANLPDVENDKPGARASRENVGKSIDKQSRGPGVGPSRENTGKSIDIQSRESSGVSRLSREATNIAGSSLSRETTFFEKDRATGPKSKQGQKAGGVGKSHGGMDAQPLAEVEEKEDTLLSEESEVDLGLVAVKKRPTNAPMNSRMASKMGGRHKQNAVIHRIDIVTKKQAKPTDDTSAQSDTKKGIRGKASAPNTKDTAHKILQKLTGKQRGPAGHRPGEVPAVGRQPRRKFKFDQPSVSKDDNSNVPKEQDSKQAMQTEPRVHAEGGDKTRASKTMSYLRPGRTYRADQRNVKGRDDGKVERQTVSAKPAPARHAEKLKQIVGEKDEKPASAPVRRQAPKSGVTVPAVKTDGNNAAVDRLSKTLPASASKSFPNPRSKIGKSDTASVNQSHSDLQKPSVSKSIKMQNGMIDNTVCESDNAQDTVSVSASHMSASHDLRDDVNVHPKLRGSPYLRNNPLLSSGKQRLRRPGARGSHVGPPGAANPSEQ